jgi:hypothetical protein
LVSILVEGVGFVRAGDITIATTIIVEIMAMAQPKTSALTVMFQVSNLDNKKFISPLVLPLEQPEILSSKVTFLVVIIAP